MKTLTVDSAKRVRIPDAKPHQVYAYEFSGGRVTLTLVEPPRPKQARLLRRGNRLYATNDEPITNEDVARIMESFP